MNAEVKAKWVAALRSGKFKQGREALRHKDQFCCLGVLCELHRLENDGVWDKWRYLGDDGVLPGPVLDWAGLDYPDPQICPDRCATEANDGQDDEVPLTFTEIADLIEANL